MKQQQSDLLLHCTKLTTVICFTVRLRFTEVTGHDRIKFKIATMTHEAIYTCNPPYLANLVQWHTPSRNLRSASANLLSVTRCNISFGARGFRSAAPAIWNSLPSNVRSCETLTTFRRHLKSHLFHSAFATA